MNIKHNKDIVIQKGIELFLSNGYQGLGVNKICTVTGMTKGAFYNAFETKENFFLHCLYKYCAAIQDRMVNALSDTELPAMQRIKNFYFDFLGRQAKLQYAGCLLNNTLSELAATHAIIGQVANLQLEAVFNAIKPTILKAQEDGEISKVLESKKIAELLHLTLFGVLSQAKGTKDHQTGTETMAALFTLLT